MQTSKRIQFWPYFPAVLAAAVMTELVRGLTYFLGAGQIVVNGQPIGKLTYLSQHLVGLARGVMLLGVPFGVLAWIVLCLSLPRATWWRDFAIVFLLVAAWNAISVPINHRLPSLLVWLGPYLVFALAVVLCRNLARFRRWTAPGIPAPSSDRSIDRRLEMDVLCARCSYNLRTLATRDDCPECGLAIEETLRSIAFRAPAVSIWKFLPIAAGFALAVAVATLIVADLHLRFRSSYPLAEGLWGNKWLPFVLVQTVVLYGAMALVCWPLFWISLRRKRLKPALGFLFVAVTAANMFALDLEHVSYAPFVVLLVALGICAWSGIFDQRPVPRR